MIQHRYSDIPLPLQAASLCPYSSPHEQAVWDDAVRAVTIFEAVRGTGRIILHRLREKWREDGVGMANVGKLGARLPKYQCALVYRLLERDEFVRIVECRTHNGAGGRPTTALEILRMPPLASEYLNLVAEALQASTLLEGEQELEAAPTGDEGRGGRSYPYLYDPCAV